MRPRLETFPNFLETETIDSGSEAELKTETIKTETEMFFKTSHTNTSMFKG